MQGSLINRLMENSQEDITVTVGMGATELLYTDRNPYTVIEVLSKNKIRVQEDKATNIGEEPYDQNWLIERDSEGTIKTLIKTKRGWKVFKGETRFRVGSREKYYDYNF